MSFPSATDHNWSRLAWSSVFALIAVTAIFAFAPSAQAAFTSAPCTGSDITGRGASFQNFAQIGWENVFDTNSTYGCASATPIPEITYEPLGSGAGRSSLGQNATGTRDPAIKYAATDEAPTPAQRAQMEAGDPSTTADNGLLHVIPVATGAMTLIINFPSDCRLPAGDGNLGTYARIQVPNSMLESVWEGNTATDEWGEMLPGIEAKPGTSRTTQQCQDKRIKRVARLDGSGTTFSFKQFLKLVDPTTTWEEPTLTNQAWPNNSGTHTVIRGAANGNGPLAAAVKATDGSIGYADLATARQQAFRKGKTGGVYTFDYGNFWIPLQNSAGAYKEPTKTVDAIVTGVHGADCGTSRYYPAGTTTIPSTLGDWSTVTGVLSGTGYPICTLTYMLVWDDSADVYGNTAAEELKARSVKDFITTVVSSAGQTSLQANDYFKLPSASANNLKLVAENAAAAVDWNK